MSEIEIKHLTFAYDDQDEKPILDDASLSIEKGQYVSILGHNGSGKSTLAKLIIGLLIPDSGKIFVQGQELNKKTVRDIRKNVSLVFQNPDNQFIGATVEDDVAFGLENRQVEHEKMQGIIDHFLQEVGMEDFKNKEPSMLSGGQKQRVAIAGALSLNPDIIIFDEATSMLDPHGKKEIAALISKMKKNNPDLTVISITHEIEEAFLSNEVIILHQGKIVAQGKPIEVFKDKEKITSYQLSVPLILDIKEQLKKEGINIKCDNNIDSLVEALCQSK